jgi:hypothetical protein
MGMTNLRTYGPMLLDGSYFVLPIMQGEKRPAVKTWQDARLTRSELLHWPADYGVGVMCGIGAHPIAAIDIDVSHPAVLEAVLKWCRDVLGVSCERIGAAPRILLTYRAAEAGWTKATSVSFFDPLDPTKPNGKPNEQRIEVLGVGQQFVAYHTHPDINRPYQWTDFFGGIAYVPASDLPIITQGQVALLLAEFERIVKMLGLAIKGRTTAVSTRVDDPDGGPFAGLTPRIGLTLIQAAEYLTHWPNEDLEYDDWLNAGMALHHEFEGAPEALEIWKQWGATSKKDDPREYGYKWTSFAKSGHRPITFAYIIKRAKEGASKEKYTAQAEWKQKIAEAADDFALREKVCPALTKDIRLGEFEREALAQVLCDRFRALGLKMPIAQCRKLLVEQRSERRQANAEGPDWARSWVYVTDDDKFFRMDSEEWLTMQGFNACFNSEMPRNEEGNITQTAGWYVLTEAVIPRVTKGVYLPYCDAEFTLQGTKCVNLYRPSSVPAAEPIGEGGRNAVAIFRRHLNLIMGGRAVLVETMLAWIAHNVQHPGVKIRWAPLIKGVEGDGKTLLGKLMQALMGPTNVTNVSPTVLGTDFTGWAEGSCVAVLEEVRIVGHSRHDIFNALKPYVTNDSVPVHRKGKDEYNILNVTNYLGFTNFADALPIGDNDRRWLIIFTPFSCRAEMAAAVAGEFASLTDYFDCLHDAIEKHPGELRRYFLDYPIPATFKPNGEAPATDEKLVMIALSSSGDEDEVRDVIESGAHGVSQRVLSSSCLNAALQFAQVERLNTTTLNRMLMKLGWTKVPKKLKWHGAAHWVWTRGHFTGTTDELRLELDATKAKSALEKPDPLFGDLLPTSEPALEPN